MPEALWWLGQAASDEVYGDLPAEREVHRQQSQLASHWLDDQPAAILERMRVFRVRCPQQGCLLAEVFRFPLHDSGERYLARSATRSSAVASNGFLNWAFSDDWAGPPVWFPASCRCGEAKLERGWLLDLVGLVRGWHHAMRTLEQDRASFPVSEQRGRARRTFHPKPEVWRPKDRRAG